MEMAASLQTMSSCLTHHSQAALTAVQRGCLWIFLLLLPLLRRWALAPRSSVCVGCGPCFFHRAYRRIQR